MDEKIKEIMFMNKLEELTKHKLTVSQLQKLIELIKQKKSKEIKKSLEEWNQKPLIDIFLKKDFINKKNDENVEETFSINTDISKIEKDIEDRKDESLLEEEINEELTHFTPEGFKKISAIEEEISDDLDNLNKENFEKHPAHFKYAGFLLSKISKDAQDSHLTTKLKNTFLGIHYGASARHDVNMFQDTGDFKTDEYLRNSTTHLRDNFSDKELLRISNAMMGTLRDYYFQEFLGMKNYENYVLTNEDSKNKDKLREKVRKIEILDAHIRNEMGMTNMELYNNLKNIQLQSGGAENLLTHVEQRIIPHMIQNHKKVTEQKIIENTISHNNLYQAQHFINKIIDADPTIPDEMKRNQKEIYQTRDITQMKQLFQHYAGHNRFDEFPYEKGGNQFRKLMDIYEGFGNKTKDSFIALNKKIRYDKRPINESIYNN